MKTTSGKNATPNHFDSMGSYWDHLALHLPLLDFQPTTDQRLSASRLTAVERATARLLVPLPHDVPVAFGTTTEATLRLALLRASGNLGSMSGQAVARYLELVFYSKRGRPSRRALSGWALLSELDRLDMVVVSVSTVGLEPRAKFRSVRLSRLASPTYSERGRGSPRYP